MKEEKQKQRTQQNIHQTLSFSISALLFDLVFGTSISLFITGLAFHMAAELFACFCFLLFNLYFASLYLNVITFRFFVCIFFCFPMRFVVIVDTLLFFVRHCNTDK